MKNVKNTNVNNMITLIILHSFLLAFVYLLFYPLHASPAFISLTISSRTCSSEYPWDTTSAPEQQITEIVTNDPTAGCPVVSWILKAFPFPDTNATFLKIHSRNLGGSYHVRRRQKKNQRLSDITWS